MFKKVNYLLISCIVLIILIFIITLTKSSFSQNLKSWNRGNIVINFKGIGPDPNNAQLNNVLVQKASLTNFPNQSEQFNLFHVSGDVTKNYYLATSNSSYQIEPYPDVVGNVQYDNYMTYTDVQTLSGITTTSGDIFYTSDITGTTSYKIQYDTVSDPSGINVDYGSNVITIDTSKAGTSVNVDYVHNKINNNGLPPGTILITFPDGSGNIVARLGDVYLGIQGNQNWIFHAGNAGPTGNQVYIFPGQSGYDQSNPNIYLTLKYISLIGGVDDGRTGDASDWINARIKEGYTTFNVSTYKKTSWACTFSNYGSYIVAKGNNLQDTSSGHITGTSC
jgi:hypothetical protein